MQPSLKSILKGKVVIVGIGNTLRGDDGVGPVLIERLEAKVKARCIDAGTTPENFSGKILKEKPDTILMVDALHLGLAPGEYQVLEKDEILKAGLTTHDISPRMFIDYLKSQSSADIYMLGIQPKKLSLGEGLSSPVEKALDKIADLIKGIENA
ncbi:MAG: hydrogenase maturation peptidase HycI [Candidatus Omnitrophota bacterium]|nr:MAG: hydrogenase maturation peptidase HycI [Candidatus Omnitrophota bacterium]